jgi:putative ABC transport system permease protein
VIATSWAQAGVEWRGEPELVNAELVSGNCFDVLGLHPARGRLLVAGDGTRPPRGQGRSHGGVEVRVREK